MNFILRKGQNFLSTKLRNGYGLLSRTALSTTKRML